MAHDLDVPYHSLKRVYIFNAEESEEANNELENMLIHGDNLLSLKALLPTFEGKIKCIYIDPPYNTGNENWIYNDNVNDPLIRKWLHQIVGKDGEDFSRHDKWLCMMYPRLVLLRKLLRDDGALVISISQQELANLLQILSEIFSDRQIVPVTVQTSGGKPSGGFNFMHEFLIFVVPKDFKANHLKFWGGNDRSPYEGLTLSTFNKVQRPNQAYPIFIDKNGCFAGVGKSLQQLIKEGYQGSKADFKYDYSVAPKGLTAIWPITAKGKECVWRFKPERLVNDWGKGFIKITESKQKNGNKYSIQYLPIGVISKVETGELKVLGREPGKPTLIFGNNQTVGGQIPTIWLEKDFFTVNGTKTLETMFPDGSPGFNYPKPVELIETIIDAVTESDDLVLDSFAGSGTTAQAVLNLNTKDGGRRKFICIEMMDYAETITAERIKRAIRGFNTQKQDEVLLFSQKISVSNLVKGAELLEMAKKIKEEADESGEFNKAAQIKVKDNQLQVTAQSASKETVSGTGGAFSFYELSYPYIGCDGLLSSEISVSELRDFIWKIETRTPLPRTTGEENGYIGTFNDTAIYLFFDNQHSKVFDRNSLNSMNQKSNNYVVYAESTIFPEEELARRNIVFKKIPRDIPRS